MIRTFEADDQGYEEAVNNGVTFVYNDFGGGDPSYKVVHKTKCRTLWRAGDRRTTVPKVCADSLEELVTWLRTERGREGEGFTFCGTCFGRV